MSAVEQSSLEDENQQMKKKNPGCGVFGRYPAVSVIIFAAIGFGVGFALSTWDPEGDAKETKATLVKWLGLIGVLFLRVLKAVVLPLVFINVILAVVDMLSLGRAVTVGWMTIGVYLLTTLLASIIGLICVLMVKGQFQVNPGKPNKEFYMSFSCADGTTLAETPFEVNGQSVNVLTCNGTGNTDFLVDDVNGFISLNSVNKRNDISLSDTIYDGVFMKMVTTNIFADFVSANFASIVLFAVVFGVALHKTLRERKIKNHESMVLSFMREIDGSLVMLINWIILLTPFAVMSLIIQATANKTSLAADFANVGYLALSTVIAMLLHFFLVYTLGLFLVTKQNPFRYLRFLIPCQTTAFATASSAATIPVTLRCVEESRQVPDAVRRFVVPLGATINMDGGAIYFPSAVIFMAVTTGNGDAINFGTYILLIIIATIGSAGTAPVPSASLVLIITAYNTVFNEVGTPATFSLILTIDWLMDRFRTLLNVTGDAVVARIVSSLADFEVLDEEELHEAPEMLHEEFAGQVSKNL